MKKLSLAAVALTMALPTLASGFTVENCMIRETIPGATTTAAYFDLHYDNSVVEKYRIPDLELVQRIEVPALTDRPEIHNVRNENGTMSMFQIPSIPVRQPRIQLKPGGLHGMLMDLKQPAKAGEVYDLTVMFAFHPDVHCQAQVLPMAAIQAHYQAAESVTAEQK